MAVAPSACGALIPSPQRPELEPEFSRVIRVRLREKEREVRFRGFDLEFLSVGGEPKRVDRLSQWAASCVDGRVVLKQVGGGRTLDFGREVRVSSPSGFVTVGSGLRLRDRLQLRAVAQGGCELVNALDVEKYLEGLVNSEFNSGWSPEAIDAQVVAARTYAYHQMRAARAMPGSTYDVEATIKDQVYEGVHKEDARAARSVQRTRDLILSAVGKPEPIKAFYHSTCGGRTELPRFVWGRPSPGFTEQVLCPYCKASPRYRWSLTATAEEIKRRILSEGGGRREVPEYVRQGELESLQIQERHPSGRASKLVSRWRWKGMSLRWDFTAIQFRAWLGLNRVRSTWFELVPQGPGAWEVAGRGFGHGVGLCQWGAKVMGEKGRTMGEILRHYYPGARLVALGGRGLGRGLASERR